MSAASASQCVSIGILRYWASELVFTQCKCTIPHDIWPHAHLPDLQGWDVIPEALSLIYVSGQRRPSENGVITMHTRGANIGI